MSRTFHAQGIDVPAFLYGTAWKEGATERLVSEALDAGFRGIDTANQRKHYFEEGAGAALRNALESNLSRDQLFIQTKFTHPSGQDHRLPYDPSANARTQVRQSLMSSLEHLGLERIDSYLIHGPDSRHGLGDYDRAVWGAMEELKQEGLIELIGISNVTAEQVETLCDMAEVPPAFVQNRCYAQMGWDFDVRRVCRDHGIVYQGFSLLTANIRQIQSDQVVEIARRLGKTIPQIIFRFANQMGMISLTGTTDRAHMNEDLDIFDFDLSEDELRQIERIGVR